MSWWHYSRDDYGSDDEDEDEYEYLDSLENPLPVDEDDLFPPIPTGGTTTMPIVKEERYFGPGLPVEGVTDAKEAYRIGLETARSTALRYLAVELGYQAGFSMWGHGEIARHWPDIERVIAESSEKFDAECSTELLAAVRLDRYFEILF